MDYQGGKKFGALKQDQLKQLQERNQKFLTDGTFDGQEDVEERLEQYCHKFMEFDEDASGDIDLQELSRMMEKLGQPKTHLELKKMIKQVDTNDSGTINYEEFLQMMFGKSNSILRIILMYEEKNKEKEKPKGVAPRRSLADLP
ncbi:uncharacterized protein MONBRDRAFT_37177 [Monosiga brevicollis MX1]|uniref:EF-hand domain-containing protein n=1 Tax=Monosiga brevicollis TaxID=81824 RepID=A9V031_MONBE|nr:uncharacterized protein MONBRDRAFT_37177 [Monosiga brevicollis MX1]EDQ88939.1 predicted protein [Monosiga brevicollis MX1]|eukprot:XP_001746044.1 hypothetical protein [Monosiga brevicollis MX1]